MIIFSNKGIGQIRYMMVCSRNLPLHEQKGTKHVSYISFRNKYVTLFQNEINFTPF